MDAEFCFCVVAVGSHQWEGCLANSTFGQSLITGALQLPEDTLLPGGEHSGPQPHVFGADEAFSLNRDLMRFIPRVRLLPTERDLQRKADTMRILVEKALKVFHLLLGTTHAMWLSPPLHKATALCRGGKLACALHLGHTTYQISPQISTPSSGTVFGFCVYKENDPNYTVLKYWRLHILSFLSFSSFFQFSSLFQIDPQIAS